MGSVITCFKSVIDENDISVGADRSVSFARAQRKISDYEKSALEAGNKIASEIGASAICLTFGTEAASQQIKDALSRGAAEAIAVLDAQADEVDPATVGKVLAAAIAKADDARVVLTADGSSDVYQKQTGPRIAAALGWPFVGNVVEVEANADGTLITQKADGAIRKIRVDGPVVIAVLPEICAPKIPGMRDILAAKKKPQTTYSIADLGLQVDSPVNASALQGFVMERKNVILEGTPEEAVAGLVDALKKEGVL